MDDRERIAKLESTVDAHRQQFDHIDKRFDRLEARMDRLEDRMERGFTELRGDIAKLTRWMVGMFVTYGIAIVGLLIKAGFGS